MKVRDRLEAPGLAGYKWGSLLLETTRFAPVDGRTIIEALASATAGACKHDAPTEIRGTIAVLHEAVHLQQDIGTGLGAWDHVTTRYAIPRLNQQARWFVMKFTDPPYEKHIADGLAQLSDSAFTMQVRRDLETVHDLTVARRQLWGQPWPTAAVNRRIKMLFGDVHGHEGEYSLRALLECEAASVVHRTLSGWRFSEAGLEQLERNASQWRVPALGGDYLDPILTLAWASTNGQPDPDEIVDHLLVYLDLLVWAVDFACAYPPPPVLAERDHQEDFDPVLRFIVVVRAINAMPVREAEILLEKIVVENDHEAAEEVLSRHAAVRYPRSGEVYERWIEHLLPLIALGEDDAELLKLRKQALEKRVDGKSRKGLAYLLDADIPIQVLVDDVGVQGILHAPQFDNDELRRQLFLNAIELELHDLFVGSGTYQCPLARGGICPGRQATCLDVTRLSDLPPSPECTVRTNLKDMGYFI